MTRIPLVSRDEFPPDQVHIYDEVANRRGGRTGNVFRALANNPGCLERVAPLGAYLRFDGILPPHLREISIVCVALELRCRYVEVHHRRLAHEAGVPKAELDLLGSEPNSFSPDAKDVIAYTQLVAGNRAVSDELLDRLRDRLGDAGLVELTVVIGYYGMLGRLLNTFEVPLEDGLLSLL